MVESVIKWAENLVVNCNGRFLTGRKELGEPKLSPIGNMQLQNRAKGKTKGTSEKCRTPLIPLRHE